MFNVFFRKKAVMDVLDNEYLGMGIETQKFECAISEYLNIKPENIAAVSTGTSALHLGLLAIGVLPGDEILVPSLTYVASFQAISACGAIPIACEVNPNTLFIDAEDARSKVTEKTKAIMPVHYASSSKGIDSIYELAHEFNLRVIEDAAQAFGCKSSQTKVGSSGDVICFSFDGIKNITCGEGGAVIAFDGTTIDKIKDMRLLGVKKDTEQRYAGKRSWDFDVELQGFRYHMSNINAAIGIQQLSRIDEFSKKRQEIAKRYVDELSILNENVRVLDFNYNEIIPHIFVIKVTDRDLLREHLISKGIECGVHYKPNHLLEKYRQSSNLVTTELIYSEVLSIPCHVDLTEDEQSYVISEIKSFYHEKKD